jgi:hypothetical protein
MWTGLGLVKKEKQLDARKLCSFFAKPQKQRCPSYFSSNTWVSIYQKTPYICRK